MPRPIWEGHITFGLVAIPVKLYSAQEASERLSFHLVDGRNMQRVHQRRVNDDGEEVPWENVVKGYEFDDGTMVTLADEDFERANVEATRTIEIVETVCADCVPPAYFDKPYYLEPVGKGGRKPYALFRESLRRAERAAVGRIVIRTREHLALLYPYEDAIVCALMRFAYEVRDTGFLDVPGRDLDELGITDKEIGLAEQLVGSLESEWDPSQFADRYHEDLLELVRAKRDAGEAWEPEPLPARGEGGEVVDLMEALKASLKAEAEAQDTAAG
jgi:DNA end-binding protein Ku